MATTPTTLIPPDPSPSPSGGHLLRQAARAAAQEDVAIEAAVDQRLGGSRACVRGDGDSC